MCSPATRDLIFVRIIANNICEMKLQSLFIRLVGSLKNIENDACETVYVKVNFLIIRNLSNFAAHLLVEY